MTSVPPSQAEGLEETRDAVIDDAAPVAAGLVAKGAGDPAFAEAGQANDRLPAFRDLRFGFVIRFILGRDKWCR